MYDVNKMIETGYSIEDIGSQMGYDVKSMREQGYKDEDITSALAGYEAPKEDTTTEPIVEQIELDALGNKEIEALNLNYQAKIETLDELKLDDKDKQLFISNLDVNKSKKEALIREESDTRWTKENKPIPSTTKNENTKDNNGFIDSMYDFQNAVMQPFNPAIDLALHWAKKTSSAIGETASDAANRYVGTDFSFYEENGQKLREEGERLNKSIDPNGKLLLKPTQMTDLVAGIAVPLKVTNPKKMLMLEGILGYTTEYSNSGDFQKAVESGAIQSAGAGAGKLLIDGFIGLITKKGTSNALEYLWNKHSPEIIESSGLGSNATKEEVLNAIEKDWLDIMQGTSSNETKVKAIIDRLGIQGAAYKRAVQQEVPTEVESIVRQPKEQRITELRGEVADVGANIEEGANALAKQVGITSKREVETTLDRLLIGRNPTPEAEARYRNIIGNKLRRGDIKEVYGDFQSAIKNKYSDEYNIDGEVLSSVKSDLKQRAKLTKGLSSAETNLANALDQPMTIDNIMGIKVEINELINSSKGTALTNAKTLTRNITKLISKTLEPEDMKLFGQLEEEYGRRAGIVGKKDINQIGASLMSFSNGNKTLDSVVNGLDKLNASESHFRDLEKVIGTNNMKKIELGIVNNLLSGDIDSVSYGVVNKSLSNMGFVTKEGKEVKKIIDKFDTVFSSDNFKILNSKVLDATESDVSAMTADVSQKLKYSASSYLFKSLKRNLLNTKGAIEYRNIQEISDILSGSKQYTRGVTINGKEIDPTQLKEIARDSIFQAYKGQIKTISETTNTNVSDEEIKEAINNSFLGMGDSYGGKATAPKSSTVGSNDYSSSLYGTKKEQEALVKVVDRYGIEGTNKANTTSYENGAKEWYSSLTNKQKEEVVSIVEAKKDRTGGYNLTDVYEQQIKSYGKNKDGSPSYNDISESLFGTQKKTKDTSGNLGMTSNYGEKATSTGGVNTKEAKDYLNRFMDDIANPKVTVDTNKINDLYGALKSEGTTMYDATTAKEKAWEDAMDIVNKMRNKNSVTPKEREQMIQAVKKYHSLINSTI